MHVHNNNCACNRGSTCDFEPHRDIRGFCGNDSHHVRHRVAFHYRKREWGFLKKQRSCVSWYFWFGNPLNVQTTSGGFLRTSIVDSFNLRERQRMNVYVPQWYVTAWVSVHLRQTVRKKTVKTVLHSELFMLAGTVHNKTTFCVVSLCDSSYCEELTLEHSGEQCHLEAGFWDFRGTNLHKMHKTQGNEC